MPVAGFTAKTETLSASWLATIAWDPAPVNAIEMVPSAAAIRRAAQWRKGACAVMIAKALKLSDPKFAT